MKRLVWGKSLNLVMFFLSDTPEFVTKLKDLSVPMNNKLKLECTFKGAPKMFVTWYKDGKQLYASYRYNTKTTPNSCILECLHECNTETTGRYSCEISNKCGSDICHAQVTVVTGQYQEMFLLVFSTLKCKDSHTIECSSNIEFIIIIILSQNQHAL